MLANVDALFGPEAVPDWMVNLCSTRTIPRQLSSILDCLICKSNATYLLAATSIIFYSLTAYVETLPSMARSY